MVFAVVVGLCSKAHGAGLREGTWSLGVERLFGVTYSVETVKAPGGDVKTSALNYSLFSNPAASQRTVYSTPRLALDYLITDDWSAGLGVGIVGGTTKTKTDSADVDGPSVFGAVFAPRAGYLAAQSKWFAFWPKAGFTVMTYSATRESAKSSSYRGAVSLEASLLARLGSSATLSLTPMIDVGLLGSNSVGDADSVRATALEFGAVGGLGVVF